MPPQARAGTNGTMMLRRLLLALLVIGLIVTGVDLVLLNHYEDVWQLIPLMLIAFGLVVVVWHLVARSGASIRALQMVMLLFVAGGAAGVVLHYRGNMAFQLEMDPTQDRWTLFNKVIRAKAPPAMAPSAMAQLGLVGLIYAFRHPALDSSS